MEFITLTALALAALAAVSYILPVREERAAIRIRTDDRRR